MRMAFRLFVLVVGVGIVGEILFRLIGYSKDFKTRLYYVSIPEIIIAFTLLYFWETREKKK